MALSSSVLDHRGVEHFVAPDTRAINRQKDTASPNGAVMPVMPVIIVVGRLSVVAHSKRRDKRLGGIFERLLPVELLGISFWIASAEDCDRLRGREL